MKKEIVELLKNMSLSDLQTAVYKKKQMIYSENLDEDDKEEYYMHRLWCEIQEYKIINFKIFQNDKTIELTEDVFIEEYQNQPDFDDNYNDYGYGELDVSIYSQNKSATKKEILLLEKKFYDIFLHEFNIQKAIKEKILYLTETEKLNRNKLNKLSFLRTEKLKKVIKD